VFSILARKAAGASGARLSLRPLILEGQRPCFTWALLRRGTDGAYLFGFLKIELSQRRFVGRVIFH
jgi:hypothetical protein